MTKTNAQIVLYNLLCYNFRWNDSLVDSVLGFVPGVPGSISSSGKNFIFRPTLVSFGSRR